MPAFSAQLMTLSSTTNFRKHLFPDVGSIAYDVRRMDNGFARSVVGQQTVLFALTLTVAAIWFGVNILDIWSTTLDVVSKRFDTIAILRINVGLAALMVASSGLLWALYRRKATAPTLPEFFFGVCLAPFLFVLISSGVPAVFVG